MLRSDWPFSQQKTTDNQDNAFPLHTPSSGKQIKSNSAKPKFKEQDKTRGMQSMRAELIVKASTPQSWALLWSMARIASANQRVGGRRSGGRSGKGVSRRPPPAETTKALRAKKYREIKSWDAGLRWCQCSSRSGPPATSVGGSSRTMQTRQRQWKH